MFTPASASQSLIKTQSVVFPEGTTIYVDISNTNGIEDGTSTYPFNTIQEAINVAVSGDVVGVAPGIYFEKVILKAGVQLVGTDPTSTILDGSGSGTVLKMENASLLTGFTVQNGRASFGAGIVTSGVPKIAKNIIQNNAQTSGGAGAAIHGNNSSPIITGNLIIGNTADTQFLSGAISFINSSSPYIANNVIRNNTGRGAINLTMPEGNKPVVINNTIVNNVGAGIKVDSRVTQAAIVIANNVLMGNSTGIQIDSGAPTYWPKFEYNDVYSNSTDYVGMSDMTGISGNLSVDPIFFNEFHLRYSSPLIDVGSLTDYSATDFDGDLRPLDGNGDGVAISDIGADERMFVDDIPPVITVTVTKENGQTYIPDTWTNQTVTVKFTCSDDESGIASCPADQIFETEGIVPLVTGTATDTAGNSASASFGPIKVDKTRPVLSIAVSPNPVVLHGTATMLTDATDNLSSVDSATWVCFTVDTTSIGTKPTNCYVSDYAGNLGGAIVQYQVIYDFEGFLSPVIDCVNNSCDPYQISFFNVGTPISLKFRLKDALGNVVQPTNAPLWLVPLQINSSPPVSFPDDYVFQTTELTYTWKKSQNIYVYDWSTRRLPARTVWLIGVKLDDGKTYYVFVALK